MNQSPFKHWILPLLVVFSAYRLLSTRSSWEVKISKIEKVPKNIRNGKSGNSRTITTSWSLVLTIKACTRPKKGTKPAVWKGKRSLLANHSRRKCWIETNLDSVEVKASITDIN